MSWGVTPLFSTCDALSYGEDHTEKMSPVYICQNDKPMTSLALSTAHQANTNLCQPHSLKSCHILGKDLSKTCHPEYLFFAVDVSQVPIYYIASNSKTFWECKHLSCRIGNIIKQN